LFYEDVERESTVETSWFGSNTSANVFGQSLLQHAETLLDYEQKAFFGEVSYQFDDQWELTIGGRYFDYDRVDAITFPIAGLPFNGGDAQEDVGESGDSYKANLSFTPNEDTLIYALWSEGFRLGRGQATPPPSCDVDPQDGILDGTDAVITGKIEADTTKNIELGAKLTFLDKRMSINTSIFQVTWANLPVLIRASSDANDVCSTLSVTNNIGEAQTQGVELEVNYNVTESLVINLAASYVDTEWTEARAPVELGERLVYSPRTNANFGLQYNFGLGSYPAYVRTDIGYVGEYETFPRINVSPAAGDYVKANLRGGITIDNWSIAVYGDNLMNKETPLYIDTDTGTRLSPRKLGLEVSYNF